jgi:hypothetical protein
MVSLMVSAFGLNILYMAARILLVNPPIYDFAAYDFWLKPYGLLSVAGYLRGRADFLLFDYLDRLHSFCAGQKGLASDKWGRARFYEERIPHPEALKQIPRYFRRFGLPRGIFQEFLTHQPACDFVFINTVMTYWYPGVREVIEDVRRFWPGAKIVLGGNYVMLCRCHAETLGADLLVVGKDLSSLWEYTGLEPDLNQPALWEAYPRLAVGALKLSDGCPFQCTYCSVPKVYGGFQPRPLARCLAELELLVKLGVSDIAFYDDALLFDAENVLVPFLNEVVKRKIIVNFHSPNALNARFVTRELADLMVRAGFKCFYLGFESGSRKWQEKTGSKIFSDELAGAVEHLKRAGAEPENIAAYQILGHPDGDIQQLEESMRFVRSLGIRGTLADFSPIPGTPDGDRCGKWVDMAEPLFHNKTAFPVILLGFDETNRIKDLQRHLNRCVG